MTICMTWLSFTVLVTYIILVMSRHFFSWLVKTNNCELTLALILTTSLLSLNGCHTRRCIFIKPIRSARAILRIWREASPWSKGIYLWWNLCMLVCAFNLYQTTHVYLFHLPFSTSGCSYNPRGTVAASSLYIYILLRIIP